MAKGNKNFILIERKAGRGKCHDVFLATTKVRVAWISNFPDSSSFRFTLVNYPQNHSKMFGTLKACLAAIEKEVL